ncbi:hypothetical protein GGX14DRAFT_388698 [Mycena pura]|uniref:Uncharacterized protein n=1 Tax=Mycena pura TaxID=153505 RepID=A0AAD6YKN9_9AGAR|nr:hypothetical protein GGX14DRAFT_388698 [Mycena pura]
MAREAQARRWCGRRKSENLRRRSARDLSWALCHIQYPHSAPKIHLDLLARIAKRVAIGLELPNFETGVGPRIVPRTPREPGSDSGKILEILAHHPPQNSGEAALDFSSRGIKVWAEGCPFPTALTSNSIAKTGGGLACFAPTLGDKTVLQGPQFFNVSKIRIAKWSKCTAIRLRQKAIRGYDTALAVLQHTHTRVGSYSRLGLPPKADGLT